MEGRREEMWCGFRQMDSRIAKLDVADIRSDTDVLFTVTASGQGKGPMEGRMHKSRVQSQTVLGSKMLSVQVTTNDCMIGRFDTAVSTRSRKRYKKMTG